MKTKFILFAFLILLCSNANLCQTNSDTQVIKVQAIVIGYSPLARMTVYIGTNRSYFLDDILIRVEKDTGDIKNGTYLRFRYNHLEHTANLPKKMFKKKNVWEFTLTRNKKCDGSLKDLLNYELDGITNLYLTRTSWAKKEVLPLDANVHCYTLSVDAYKKL